MVKGAADGYEKHARARRHRLPRRGQGQDAAPRARLLAPGQLPAARRHHAPTIPADSKGTQLVLTSRRQGDDRSDRPPRSAASVRRSPTAARAFATGARRSARRRARPPRARVSRRELAMAMQARRAGAPQAPHPQQDHRHAPSVRASRVFRSAQHIYAQVVDDVAGKTLAHASTLSKRPQGHARRATTRPTPPRRSAR